MICVDMVDMILKRLEQFVNFNVLNTQINAAPASAPALWVSLPLP